MDQSRRNHAFTILDVLIVIVIISVLLAILTPSLGRALEQARRVKCQSGLQQMGLALTMWTDEHDGMLPATSYAESKLRQFPRLLQVANVHRLASRNSATDFETFWDSLGQLVEGQYLNAPELLYCPSHTGEHPFDRHKASWQNQGAEIVINYHFRWLSGFDRALADLNPEVTLVTDGLRTTEDYNHTNGNNLLKADMHVEWFTDDDGRLVNNLPTSILDTTTRPYTARQVMVALDTGVIPDTADELDRLSPFITASRD